MEYHMYINNTLDLGYRIVDLMSDCTVFIALQ